MVRNLESNVQMGTNTGLQEHAKQFEQRVINDKSDLNAA